MNRHTGFRAFGALVAVSTLLLAGCSSTDSSTTTAS